MWIDTNVIPIEDPIKGAVMNLKFLSNNLTLPIKISSNTEELLPPVVHYNQMTSNHEFIISQIKLSLGEEDEEWITELLW